MANYKVTFGPVPYRSYVVQAESEVDATLWASKLWKGEPVPRVHSIYKTDEPKQSTPCPCCGKTD